MAFNVGQQLIYTSPKGKEIPVTIVKRKVDYKDGFIDEPNYKGNFVHYEGNEGMESMFCSHKELRE
ncbi:MAG: hypothetical protein R2781_06950 [Flavobacteriaceae bacterium]